MNNHVVDITVFARKIQALYMFLSSSQYHINTAVKYVEQFTNRMSSFAAVFTSLKFLIKKAQILKLLHLFAIPKNGYKVVFYIVC